jgi:hypothetical protein
MIRPTLSVFAAALVVAAIAAPVAAQQTPARPAPSAQTPAPVAQADIAWAKETLTALGFNAGRADGAVTDLFRQRLREFQGRNSLTVNGQSRQNSDLKELIWNVAETIEHLSAAWTLQPGDLIYTGTPAGVAAVVRGDVMEGQVAGLPTLRVAVR